MLEINHQKDLYASGLSDASIAAMGVYSVTGLELANAIQGFGVTGQAYKASGYAIPYFNMEGETVFTRFKMFWSEVKDSSVELPKYLSPAKAINYLYLPRGVKSLLDTNDYVIVTEGEKKAAKAVQEGFPCVAISGVWNWVDAVARGLEKQDGKKVSYLTTVLKELKEISKTHKVILMFDSDVMVKPQVKQALFLLKEALRFQSAPWVCRVMLPVPDGDDDLKWGIDDLLCHADGIRLLRTAVDNALIKPSEDLKPLIHFPYSEVDGQLLHYTIPNTPINQEYNIHVVWKDKWVEDKDSGKGQKIPEKIATTRVWLNRLVKSVDGDNKTLYELGFVPLDNRTPHYISGGSELISLSKTGNGEDTLAEYGARVLSKERPALEEFFNQCHAYGVRHKQVAVVKGTKRRGWQHFDEGQMYVTASKVICGDMVFAPENPDIPVLPVDISSDGAVKEALVCKGDYEIWRNTMIKYVITSPIPALMAAASVAGVLRHWCPDSENFIVHLYGESSHGKTIALQAGASIWGHPEKLKDNWRATDNGLERRCAARNDMVIFLDEAGQATSEDIVKNAVYMIGNGGEKMRATKEASDRATRKFALVALSNGEKQLIRDAKFAGQEVRTLEIHAETLGNLWPSINGSKEAEELNATLLSNYGWGIEPFIKAVTREVRSHPDKIHQTHMLLTSVLRKKLSDTAPVHIKRRVKHYGLLLTAYGFLLEHCLLLPIETVKKEMDKMINMISSNLLEVATDQFKSGEKSSILQHFMDQLSSNQSRFYTEQQVPSGMVWGLIKDEKAYCIPGPLGELIKPFDSGRLLFTAEDQGILIINEKKSKNNRKQSVRIGTLRPDCYVFDLKKIQSILEKDG